VVERAAPMESSSSPSKVPSIPPVHGHGHAAGNPSTSVKLKLAMAALGVVFGDIGTSPLYALKECFVGEHAVAPTPANVYGVLSLVVWALLLVIVVKYLTFIMRADNQGEGGILALLALLRDPKDSRRSSAPVGIVLLVLFGAALLYGDGVITPAISVLSAIEGLSIATTALTPASCRSPVSCCSPSSSCRSAAPEGIGRVFGPVTLVWFVAIGALGLAQIVEHPEVLAAVDPRHAVASSSSTAGTASSCSARWSWCITGGEALYADMGHFGRGPIRLGWFAVVFPALLLNYFGQGALLLNAPETPASPFYAIVPGWALYPMVAIATAATVVASQALISGAFSLTQQAVQLGYFPRVTIVHTSKDTEGQIYIPEINRMLLVACIGLVLAFQKSTPSPRRTASR
jgi:KUP system potassium uptake protein